MKVGFTGTRDGMTQQQRMSFLAWIQKQPGGGVDEFHHGCCVGADATAVDIVDFMPRALAIVAHTPHEQALVSAKAIERSTRVRASATYLTRNRNIVDATDILLACPKGPEELRSGTWSTIRYARKCGKRVVIFWPDGTTTDTTEPTP